MQGKRQKLFTKYSYFDRVFYSRQKIPLRNAAEHNAGAIRFYFGSCSSKRAMTASALPSVMGFSSPETSRASKK